MNFKIIKSQLVLKLYKKHTVFLIFKVMKFIMFRFTRKTQSYIKCGFDKFPNHEISENVYQIL